MTRLSALPMLTPDASDDLNALWLFLAKVKDRLDTTGAIDFNSADGTVTIRDLNNQIRVLMGQLGAGPADWGIQLYDPAGVLMWDSLQGGALTSGIAAGAVTADQLGALAVTTAKLDGLAVTAPKLDTAAVTTPKIDTAAVTTLKIGANAVTNAATVNVGGLDGTVLGIYQPIPAMSLAFTTSGGVVLVTVSMSVLRLTNRDAGNTLECSGNIQLYRDGVPIQFSRMGFLAGPSADLSIPFTMNLIDVVAPGTYTYSLAWSVGGSGLLPALNSDSTRILQAVELKR